MGNVEAHHDCWRGCALHSEHDDAWEEIKHNWDWGWPTPHSDVVVHLTRGTARCHECLAPGEDPSPWCNCRHDETCLGPCANCAHYPQHCSTPGKGLKEEIRRKNEVTGPIADAADNWAANNPMCFKIALTGRPFVVTVDPNKPLQLGTTDWDRRLLRLVLQDAVRKLDTAITRGDDRES